MSKKSFIVVPDVSKLTEEEFVVEIDLKSQAMEDNDTTVPGINPTPTVVKDKLQIVVGEMKDRELLRSDIKEKDENITTGIKEISDIMNNQWANQIQNALNITKGKVEALRFKVKGTGEVIPLPEGCVPLNDKIDLNIAGQHTLYFVDSIKHKRALPTGIARIDVYGQTGGTAPTNLIELIANGGGYLGEADRGKYKNVLASGNKGKIEYYIAVYISKKTKKPFSYSIVFSAPIN